MGAHDAHNRMAGPGPWPRSAGSPGRAGWWNSSGADVCRAASGHAPREHGEWTGPERRLAWPSWCCDPSPPRGALVGHQFDPRNFQPSWLPFPPPSSRLFQRLPRASMAMWAHDDRSLTTLGSHPLPLASWTGRVPHSLLSDGSDDGNDDAMARDQRFDAHGDAMAQQGGPYGALLPSHVCFTAQESSAMMATEAPPPMPYACGTNPCPSHNALGYHQASTANTCPPDATFLSATHALSASLAVDASNTFPVNGDQTLGSDGHGCSYFAFAPEQPPPFSAAAGSGMPHLATSAPNAPRPQSQMVPLLFAPALEAPSEESSYVPTGASSVDVLRWQHYNARSVVPSAVWPKYDKGSTYSQSALRMCREQAIVQRIASRLDHQHAAAFAMASVKIFEHLVRCVAGSAKAKQGPCVKCTDSTKCMSRTMTGGWPRSRQQRRTGRESLLGRTCGHPKTASAAFAWLTSLTW